MILVFGVVALMLAFLFAAPVLWLCGMVLTAVGVVLWAAGHIPRPHMHIW